MAPDKCVVVEDSTSGILAAKNAKMYYLVFSNLDYDQTDQSKVDKIINDLRVLTPSFFETGLV